MIDYFLHMTALCAPPILLLKPKFHILLHIPFFIRRFGPAILASTERFESFNTVFRHCSVLSNRQAPSRDIAAAFAGFDRCRHMSSGGFWKESISGGGLYVRCGENITSFLEQNKEFRALLGLPSPPTRVPGKYVILAAEGALTHGARLSRLNHTVLRQARCQGATAKISASVV